MREVGQVITGAFGGGFDSVGTLGFPGAAHRGTRVVQVTSRKGVLLRLHDGPERNKWHLESQSGSCATW
jgi:hypothetical protein